MVGGVITYTLFGLGGIGDGIPGFSQDLSPVQGPVSPPGLGFEGRASADCCTPRNRLTKNI
jgi:hypothetical protein